MKNNTFELKILTSIGIVFHDFIIEIVFLSSKGYMTILKNHTPISGIVQKGKCLIKTEKENIVFFHTEGAFSFVKNQLKFIVNNCGKEDIFSKELNFSKNKSIFIGDNEIIENHHIIETNYGKKDEIIEFEFKKIFNNIK